MQAGERTMGRQAGFTLVWALAALAIMAAGLSVVGPLWAERARRDREADILRYGRAYALAIAAYRQATPGGVKQYPNSLNELLIDRRFIGTRRHLRRLYPDPLDPQRPWGLIRDSGGGIRGVYLQSSAKPLRREAMALGAVFLPAAWRYDQWHFVAQEPSP